MFRQFQDFLRTARPGSIVVLSLLGFVIVTWVDYRTGPSIEMSVFYLPSIAAVAWYLGWHPGIAMALLSTVGSITTDWASALPHMDTRLLVANGGARLLFFLFSAGMISLVARQNSRVLTMAREDPLTGIPNRRAFFEELDRELEWSRRHDTPLVLAYLDVDDFKRINDGPGGHAEGDAVLGSIAKALRDGTRKVDTVGRLGGDEFALLLPGTDPEQAKRVIEHVLGLVRERLRRQVDTRGVTLSVGVVAFTVAPASADTAVALTDACMYGVKQVGKNRVAIKTWP